MLKTLQNSISLLCFAALGTGYAQQPAEVMQEQESLQEALQESQSQIEDLDDETASLVGNYNRELARYQDLIAYNENMRQLLQSQEEERNRIANELQEVEVVRQAIVPLMLEMVEVLERYIDLDSPMLSDEREARLSQLKSIVTRSDVDTAEKYRRIIEAYQIEAEYGQSIEAYEAQVSINGADITVDLLRIGRVGLFFMSLDRTQAGIWNKVSKNWTALEPEHFDELEYALRVAREQAPPNLIELPLWTEGTFHE